MLREYISIKSRFQRSANLYRDYRQDNGLSGYVITPLVQQTLKQIANGLVDNSPDRAFILTGPYGSGKSSFALLLCQLLQARNSEAWKILNDVDAPFAKEVSNLVFNGNEISKGFIVLPITARRASVSSLLSEACESLPQNLLKSVREEINGLYSTKDIATSIRQLEKINEKARKQGYRGTFIIIDELGKVFEEAYYNRQHTDLNILQELAEAATRSGNEPLCFLGMLHQNFSNYVEDINDTKTKNEFSKIEGRFQSLAFIESPIAQLRLLSSAFSVNKKLPETAAKCQAECINNALENQLNRAAGLSAEDFTLYGKTTWPLHPCTLLALPLIFRRFGQNERSAFTFLSSNEPLGFQEFLNGKDDSRLFKLSDLYDYLLANYETQLSHHTQGKAFLEANDILNSKALTAVQCKIVKTVAILSSLGKQSHVKASHDFIKFALDNDFDTNELNDLVSKSILVFRKFNNTYGIWEGSDIDLQICLERADQELRQSNFALSIPLRHALPPKPIIAKRHSFKTGALRYFDVDYIDTPDDFAACLKHKHSPNSVGCIYICFASSEAVRDTFVSLAKKQKENGSILFAIPEQIDELRDALTEIQRLKWITDNIKELRDDRVALREIELRQTEAKQRIAQFCYSLTDPRPLPQGCHCTWVWKGEKQPLKCPKDVSVLLSNVCDELYHLTPIILNEMINKRQISGQAAAARNNLVKAMLDTKKVSQQYFGIEGFPPDRSIYEGVLQASDLHRQENGVWQMAAPKAKNKVNLLPAWKKIDELIFEDFARPIELKELYKVLSEPPFGILDGVLPILLVAFFAVNKKELTLYKEGTFLPEPTDANFELMIRRPDLFAIAGAKLAGLRKKIIDRLAKGLECDSTVPEVVKRLYQMRAGLSKYALNTSNVSETTKAYRQAFEDARQPEQLLFDTLPCIFGLSGITASSEDEADFDNYFKKLNECNSELASLLPNLLSGQRQILLEACGFENTPDGWKMLYQRCQFLLGKCNNTELIPFLQNITNTLGNWDKADAVLGYMSSKTLANWTELDCQKFPGLAHGKGQLFQEAYQPYQFSVGTLTWQEQQEASALKRQLQERLGGKSSLLVQKAALLELLRDLESNKE